MGGGETLKDSKLTGMASESSGPLAAWLSQTGGTSHLLESRHPSLVNRAVVTKEGTSWTHRMLAQSFHLLSQGASPGPCTHPRVYCLSAAVCVTNACPTRGIKNNPVPNSVSQNNCLQSALLERMATKIRFPECVCVCVRTCVIF